MDDDVVGEALAGDLGLRHEADGPPFATDQQLALALVTDGDGLAVAQVDQACLLLLDVLDELEGAVVEDRAVLVDLDDRRAAVGGRRLEHLGEVLAVGVHRPRDEGALRAERERDRVEGGVHAAHRRGFRHQARLRGRAVLPLGQAVDAVVEEQDRHVDVAPHRVDEVVATDREGVAVTRHDPHGQVGAARRQTRRDRRRATVDRVHAVRVEVVREPRGAADAGDEGDVFLAQAQLGQEALDGREDGVVAAPRAPAHLLVGGEVLAGLLLALGEGGDAVGAGGDRGDAEIDAHAQTSWRAASMTSARSATLKGRPRTEVWDRTSTRYFARSSIASCPRFISGTMTRS